MGFDQGVVLGIATTMLRDGAATGVGNPQHGLSGTTDVIKVQTTSESAFPAQIVHGSMVFLVIFEAA
ncbi:hypothetical protein [Mycobacterium marinum]|uniref:hypothetical protein n=2 Tax=Mycobacterium marinum TaxID=1781 RepID=UPI0021C4A16C|nr:hypothetical protein [Mycobacterium marinum]WCS18467.1 hypothetical protein MML61_00580 [Mycobacterium marinum]